ncbi:cyclic pyranopterin monophosphate synthase MoaC [Sphingomonas sp. HDW15A]|uniref:cyclic pyranopterin monophosphate synthase MoaC n=1 Tax=Sphingomonas sp. HDW15A TaxID=2714942 RepID=UPI001409340B|nr:cyclic pyranopterin monophosphate synthase MoaC [Sphingomonas sp. HDW15A]QIK95775.1 cyclic pyranopterin monophosphate synthase MoaC [Sphingomonas sp. HDW15A]
MTNLTHLDETGRARMVDVSDKEVTARIAKATGQLRTSSTTLQRVREGNTPKGAVIQTAELAGVIAAKKTADLIPLCHPIALTQVQVKIEIDDQLPGFKVESEVRTVGQTGVEMEALTAVSVACLTLFDMLKAIDRMMVVDNVRVAEKSGGRSGDWKAE